MDWVPLIGGVINLGTVAFWLIYFKRKELKRKKEEKEPYIEKARLSEVCWVKALDRLNSIRQDPEVTHAAMILGWQKGSGHSWIEYRRGEDIVQYDPTTEKIVTIKSTKPTVEPKEPKWRLKLKQFLASCNKALRPTQK